MKYLILVLLLLTISIHFVNSKDCPRCLDIDDECNINDTTVTCPKGSFCSPISQTCKISVPENGNCTVDLECENTLGCINSTCIQTHYLGMIELCTHDSECTTPTLCKPYSCGQTCNKACNYFELTCTTNGQCQFPMVCTSGKCNTAKNDGESCKISSECQPYSTCSENICQSPYSMDLGENCTSDYSCDISKNLICSSNGTCIKDLNQTSHCGSLDPSVKKSIFCQLEKCRILNECQVVDHMAKKSCIYQSCGELVDKLNGLNDTCNATPSNSNSQSVTYVHSLLVLSLFLFISLII
ncbi:hypothetical protein PPL_11101 [Heterostelium album PN500]|uniref:Uncharacterized protein n=1 Tax=Heterostelium pallidum (strain ATCC 26659 / Pp 5 / PN500) TaxID=670386 RepID=D3BSY1_HETP5|nr:hypothetical protein PPL_11101 [Heterostelium album PN500]EFA75596.1 hypothetical protein PPL_11101 [Heterostelium album PN500]|eukprot:XP_020427730.1 hypothetical protein PPL_11101 [Heterostelium album PN500]